MPQAAAKPSSRKKPLTLKCALASEVMSHNPISLTSVSTLKRALVFLMDNHFSAAPVIDEAGRAVGVISLTDIMRHVKKQCGGKCDESGWVALPNHGYFGADIDAATAETEVHHVMTPMVFSVTPNTSVKQVIDAMLAENVHRLFVVDDGGVLVGVISTFDILKRLRQ